MSRPVLVTGGTGLVGRSLVRRLEADGRAVVAVGSERDLRAPDVARALLGGIKPEVVFHLAARVGGIYANSTQKAGFYRDNVLINTHLVDAAVEAGVEYVFAMGTGCAYPKRLEGEILYEDDYLDGIPEETNDAYASNTLDFAYCLPANIYGPHDNFHPRHSHVVAALIRKFVEASEGDAAEVPIWGDGSARRDFLYIDDCIDAMALLLERRFSGVVNVATGVQTSIGTLAETIGRVAGYAGAITYDTSMPAGQMGRTFDTARIAAMGWVPGHDLERGLEKTVAWFREHRSDIRER
jgi:GDP-L-fucose synthase